MRITVTVEAFNYAQFRRSSPLQDQDPNGRYAQVRGKDARGMDRFAVLWDQDADGIDRIIRSSIPQGGMVETAGLVFELDGVDSPSARPGTPNATQLQVSPGGYAMLSGPALEMHVTRVGMGHALARAAQAETRGDLRGAYQAMVDFLGGMLPSLPMPSVDPDGTVTVDTVPDTVPPEARPDTVPHPGATLGTVLPVPGGDTDSQDPVTDPQDVTVAPTNEPNEVTNSTVGNSASLETSDGAQDGVRLSLSPDDNAPTVQQEVSPQGSTEPVSVAGTDPDVGPSLSTDSSGAGDDHVVEPGHVPAQDVPSPQAATVTGGSLVLPGPDNADVTATPGVAGQRSPVFRRPGFGMGMVSRPVQKPPQETNMDSSVDVPGDSGHQPHVVHALPRMGFGGLGSRNTSVQVSQPRTPAQTTASPSPRPQASLAQGVASPPGARDAAQAGTGRRVSSLSREPLDRGTIMELPPESPEAAGMRDLGMEGASPTAPAGRRNSPAFGNGTGMTAPSVRQQPTRGGWRR